MKVLIVCSATKEIIAPFISDQVSSLNNVGIITDFFFIEKGGISGYLKRLPLLKRKISCSKPDIVHAHYGLCGLLASLQCKVPVIITFHGSDINNKFIRYFSIIAYFLSDKAIFVTWKLSNLLYVKRPIIIPCAVDLDVFRAIPKVEARKKLGWSLNGDYILFSSSFDNAIKNYALAYEAVILLNKKDIQLMELKGLSRDEVCLYLNASDCALMTSYTEGSPQFIKEALACNCPIVSTDVGDVSNLIENVDGCYLTSFDPIDVSNKIQLALNFAGRTNGRNRIIVLGLDSSSIAKRIFQLYNEIISK